MSHLIPLHLLQPDETARIVTVEGDPGQINRLHEMGLREGVTVQMLRPGEPCLIALGNHRLSFRGSDSASIFVSLRDSVPHGAEHEHA